MYKVELSFLLPEFPESHCGSSRHIEGIDIVLHGDAYHIICSGDGVLRQSVTFCAHDDGQTTDGFQDRCIEGDALRRERHSRRTETIIVETGKGLVDPGPRHQKDGSHRHTDGPTVKRVAGVACQQNRIDA